MEVNLICLSKPSAITDCYTAEELVAYCARVSNPGNQNNKKTAAKLLNYLAKHGHWSPFEMVHLTLEVVSTRDIVRQILRHRSFSFQEFSQRYGKVDMGTFQLREARLQDTKNRQNSIEVDDESLKAAWETQQGMVISAAKYAYEWALDQGIAKEQARAVLPEGLTQSTIYMAGTLRSWIHYVALRQTKGTQKEHRDIASRCLDIIQQHFPSVESELIDGLTAQYEKE
jgi:thymidylate synthase (FAD)